MQKRWALLLVVVASLVLVTVALAANTITDLDGGSADVGLYTSIALTSAGAPVIGYYDATNDGVWVAVCTDVECTGTTISFIDSAGSGSFTSVAMTNTDFPIISYYNSVPADLNIAICSNTDCTAKSLVTLDSGLAGSYTSLDLTTAGNPVVSYYDHSASGDVKIAVCGDNACTTSTLTIVDGGPEDRGLFTSLQLAAGSIPVIAYHSLTGGDLYLARCADPTCTTSTISLVDGANNVGYDNISLQLDGSGNPIMSYYDSTLTALKVAHCSDDDCSGPINIEIVDNSGSVGQFSSMKWDGAKATISYYDATNGALKIAYCADADCSSATIETIDTAGDVGWDTSLALGSAHVSYYDVTNGDLKYAYVPDPVVTGDITDSAGPAGLPETGFARGRVTVLGTAAEYEATDMQLVIPSLGIETDIVGVPAVDGAWDVSWLGDQAGLLEGSAFPTWPGNAVITGHVWDSYDRPGVFAGLSELDYGDRVEIRSWGQTYVYEVRATELVSPRNLSVLDAKDDFSWITLVTCEGYNAATGEYWYRRAVSAVLVEVR